MKKKQQTLNSPYKGLLQLEVLRLMKEGWAVKKPIRLVWNWTRFNYVFKIVLEKNDQAVEKEKMVAELKEHIENLAKYNNSLAGS